MNKLLLEVQHQPKYAKSWPAFTVSYISKDGQPKEIATTRKQAHEIAKRLSDKGFEGICAVFQPHIGARLYHYNPLV